MSCTCFEVLDYLVRCIPPAQSERDGRVRFEADGEKISAHEIARGLHAPVTTVRVKLTQLFQWGKLDREKAPGGYIYAPSHWGFKWHAFTKRKKPKRISKKIRSR